MRATDLLEPNNLRPLLGVITGARELAIDLRDDLSLVRTLIRALGPMGLHARPRMDGPVFPPMQAFAPGSSPGSASPSSPREGAAPPRRWSGSAAPPRLRRAPRRRDRRAHVPHRPQRREVPDRRGWPGFMRLGHAHARAALLRLSGA